MYLIQYGKVSIYHVVFKMKIKMKNWYYLSPPPIKSLNCCIMSGEFHNLKSGHYVHNNNATILFPNTVKSKEENII